MMSVMKGGRRMLEPVTKKYEDGSTLEVFRFTFLRPVRV